MSNNWDDEALQQRINTQQNADFLSIVPLHVRSSHEVIATLERALEAARRGEIVSLSYAATLRDGSIQTAISPPGDHVFTQFGAIERLKLRFYELYVECPEPS